MSLRAMSASTSHRWRSGMRSLGVSHAAIRGRPADAGRPRPERQRGLRDILSTSVAVGKKLLKRISRYIVIEFGSRIRPDISSAVGRFGPNNICRCRSDIISGAINCSGPDRRQAPNDAAPVSEAPSNCQTCLAAVQLDFELIGGDDGRRKDSWC